MFLNFFRSFQFLQTKNQLLKIYTLLNSFKTAEKHGQDSEGNRCTIECYLTHD